ncbi:phosphatase PAP2 family protein [Streptomyces physcomitrii]|uniref:Phosphatase PAP2 family protein n=1 Tax=Streptomyces physcomitrii TaxID=2724184 RepID=A0ABX1H3S4_9ACTN|nr:phosphatase PAP2 family protein [Streptomyces physcomitrii]NKI41924.1 phosphatase PAP2 family protein [Streptomyces physcomitrii]
MHHVRAALSPQAHGGPGVDGGAYLDGVDLAHRAPAWLNDLIAAYSTYGLLLFAVLTLAGWRHARRHDPGSAVRALAVPLLTVVAFAVSSLVKQAVREVRPCQSLHVSTVEACAAPGDWAFPSNHATLAAAAAVALWFVSARLGAVASLGALAMGGSRVWVGAHYPHDVLVGLVLGALVAFTSALLVSRYSATAAGALSRSRLRPLVVS